MNEPDDDLEQRLRDLAARTTYPATPPLAEQAIASLRQSEDRGWHRRLSPGLALALVLIVAGVAAAAAWGWPGLRILLVPNPPTPNISSDPALVRAVLGAPIDMATARTALGPELLLPAGLGEPDEVFSASTVSGGVRVAFVYRTRDTVPALDGDIGLIVTEWSGDLGDGFAYKWLSEGHRPVEEVRVRGVTGYWISGPHTFEYLDEVSGSQQPIIRLVGDVLAWEADGAIYRIESPLGEERTVALAESMTP